MNYYNFINYKEFENVDIRIGTVIEAYEYNELKKPSIILKIDFGEKVGIKKLLTISTSFESFSRVKDLINKDIDLYGLNLSVEPVEKLRPQIQFNNIDQLSNQIKKVRK